MSDAYAELHCHSNFSFLDGTSDPDALVERAAELGLAALALTDAHGLYGIVRFMAAIERRRATGGPRGIVGAELTLDDGERLVLLVRDLTGYRNLCWLLTQAHLRSEKGRGQATVAALLEGADAPPPPSPSRGEGEAGSCLVWAIAQIRTPKSHVCRWR